MIGEISAAVQSFCKFGRIIIVAVIAGVDLKQRSTFAGAQQVPSLKNITRGNGNAVVILPPQLCCQLLSQYLSFSKQYFFIRQGFNLFLR